MAEHTIYSSNLRFEITCLTPFTSITSIASTRAASVVDVTMDTVGSYKQLCILKVYFCGKLVRSISVFFLNV